MISVGYHTPGSVQNPCELIGPSLCNFHGSVNVLIYLKILKNWDHVHCTKLEKNLNLLLEGKKESQTGITNVLA
jgi:hypothetical protein